MKKEKKSQARKTSTKPTRIWKFAGEIETPDAAMQILRMANRYYNKLIEINRARHERYVATRRSFAPELAVLEDRWVELDDKIGDLYRQAKLERQQHWRDTDGEKRRILPPEFEARKEELKAQQKEVSKEAKVFRQAFAELSAPAYKAFKARTKELAADRGPRAKEIVNANVLAAMLAEDEWHPAWKEIVRSNDTALKAEKAERARNGLHGGTYQGVDDAIKQAKKDSSPRTPGFHSFSGGGRIRVQLKKGTTWAGVSGPRQKIEHLERRPGAGKRSNMIRIRLDQTRGKGRRKGPRVEVSAICKLHRLPPADAEVKWLALVVRRVGRRTTCELQLTLEHESFSEAKRPAGVRAPTHIRLGWSRVNGGIRVGTGLDYDVVCPDALLDRNKFTNHLESVRDRLAGEAVNRMRKAVRIGGQVGGFAGRQIVDGRTWQRLQSDRGRFDLRRLAIEYAVYVLKDPQERWQVWRHERLTATPKKKDLYAPIAELRVVRKTWTSIEIYAWWCYLWARKDQHLEQYVADMRRRFTNQREAHYRREAIRIATEYESVTIDNYKIDELKKLELLTMPGKGVRDAAQSQLHTAAPGRFREILLEVMGPRCTPCKRPGDEQNGESAREDEKESEIAVDDVELDNADDGEDDEDDDVDIAI